MFCSKIGTLVKKNGAAGEGRNRRALLDIGNVVTLKGVEVKPNLPVT
ncbi:G2/mitotic-specific cyclin s13-6, partial [Trifolium pratense]